MKTGTIVLVAATLAVGVLIGLIYSNMQRETAAPAASAPPVQAAANVTVNQQQQISTLEGIVKREPDNRNAWIQLGHALFDAEQPMRAIDAYGKALELNGNDPNVLTDQGVMYRRVGWYEKAIANFKKANELAPDHQQSLYNLGIVYRYDLQDFANAAAAWERFLVLTPAGPVADKIRAEVDFLKNHPAAMPASQ